MQARKEGSILGQVGESIGEEALDQQVGLLEGGDLEDALHERDGDDLGIAELGAGVVGGAPSGQVGVGLEEVIGKAEGNEHLVGYTHSESGPFAAERGLATAFYCEIRAALNP